jgi:hypothetical protein
MGMRWPHTGKLAEGGAMVGAVAVALAPDPSLRTPAAIALGVCLVVAGQIAAMYGIAVLAYAAGGPLSALLSQLAGPLGAIVSSTLTVAWLIGMAIPAAVATDRWAGPLMSLGRRALRIPYLRSVLAGFAAITVSLLSLGFTTQADPLKGSIQLAFLSAAAVAAISAVREDRRRMARIRAAAARPG